MMASKLIMKGAIAGREENQFLIAQKYFFGHGEDRNYEVAAAWYKEAARRGHAAAQYMYAYILLTGIAGKVNVKLGNAYLKKSAAKNNLNAILLLARNYYYGLGFEKDLARNRKMAFKLWQKGANLGCAEAEYYLGLCYCKGIHVKTDMIKSKKHILSALEKGFSPARGILVEVAG